MAVKKPMGQFRLVQDLRAVNNIVEGVHAIVSNLYMLMTGLKGVEKYYSVIDIKDAFFCIPLAPSAYPAFSFQWEGPRKRAPIQLHWTVLPQGFKNSPTLFGQTFARDLQEWEGGGCTRGVVLQYVGDLLCVTETEEGCRELTASLLNWLAVRGYRVSKDKVQLAKEEVQYLSFLLKAGGKMPHYCQKRSCVPSPHPETAKQLCGFLGMSGYCRKWISNCGLIAKPLFEALKEMGKRKAPLEQTDKCQKAFESVKSSLMTAPALVLPDLRKPYDQFVHKWEGIALGVLTQMLGSWR